MRSRQNLRCFRLNSTDVDLLCRSDLVIVKHAMLERCTHHPDRTLTFDQDAATAVEVDLIVI